MKKFIAFSLAFLLLILCCGCSNTKTNTYLDLPREYKTREDVEFYTESDAYPCNIVTINYRFGYVGEERGIIITTQDRQAQTLHKLVDGEWKQIDYRDDYVYQLIYSYPHFHKAGDILEGTIRTDCFVTPLEKGTYRVAIKAFIPTDDTYFEDGEFLYYEFQGDGEVFVSEPFTIG